MHCIWGIAVPLTTTCLRRPAFSVKKIWMLSKLRVILVVNGVKVTFFQYEFDVKPVSDFQGVVNILTGFGRNE